MTCPAVDKNAGVILSSHMASLKPMFACSWAVGKWVWLTSRAAHIFASETMLEFVFLAAPLVPSVTCRQGSAAVWIWAFAEVPWEQHGVLRHGVPLLHLPFRHCHCSGFAEFMPLSKMLSWEVAGCCAVCVGDKLRISYFVS